MGKGVLLEVEGRQGIVLTPGGEFRRVRLTAAAPIGSEVTFPDTGAGRGANWWLVAAAVLLLGALAPLAAGRLLVGPVVALVAVDINPSVEFDVSASGRVAAARARNADGAAVLAAAGRTWGRPVEVAVAAVTDVAVQKGYLQPADAEAAVLITVAPAGRDGLAEAAEAALEGKLQAAAARVVASRYAGAAQVHAVGATAADKAAAERLGVPLGKYLQYEAARAQDPSLNLTPAQIRDMKLGQLKKAMHKPADAGQILDRVHDQQAQKGKGAGARPAGGPGRGRAPEDKKPEKPDDKTSEDKKPEDKKPEDKKPEDKKPEDKKPDDKKPDDKTSEDKKPEDKKPEDKKPEDRPGEDRGRGLGQENDRPNPFGPGRGTGAGGSNHMGSGNSGRGSNNGSNSGGQGGNPGRRP